MGTAGASDELMGPITLTRMDLVGVSGGAAEPQPSCADLERQFRENKAKSGPEYYFARWTYLRRARWDLSAADRAQCSWARDTPMP